MLKHLGRLAWKSVNMVVTLTKQQRMKMDPKFGAAVQHLCMRQCTYEDLDLFNSRIICSSSNGQGINLSSNGNQLAAAIISTNASWENLNMCKAAANCTLFPDNLIICAANNKLHKLSGTLMQEIHQYLLGLDVAAFSSAGALPGFISLYVGMPIILRSRNLSTYLGITNGSQGIVRKIYTAICAEGYSFCTCALVEFTGSQVCIPGLPEGTFPITPISWMFATLPPGSKDASSRLHVTCEQLPIQPAFTVMGHSAQGKTLPKVIVNLHEGGFGAYVAASCAYMREGLCLTELVTLDYLNKPLPYDLLLEMRRFEALEHNTYVLQGLLGGDLVSIPDPESERELCQPQPKATFDVGTYVHSKYKRPACNAPEDVAPPPQKVAKYPAMPCTACALDHQQLAPNAATAGCRWSASDWSCTYDCAFMVLFYIYQTAGEEWKRQWCMSNVIASGLATSYVLLCASSDAVQSADAFDALCDHFRYVMTTMDSRVFPQCGQLGTSASHIFELITAENIHAPQWILQCSKACPHTDTHQSITQSCQVLPTVCDHNAWVKLVCEGLTGSLEASSVSSKTWMKMFLQAEYNQISQAIKDPVICSACSSAMHPHIFYYQPLQLLTSEVVPMSLPALFPSPTLTVPLETGDVVYNLHGIIYFGSYHFSARLVDGDDSVWQYNGCLNRGVPTADVPASHCVANDLFTSSTLLNCQGSKGSHLLVYALQEDSESHAWYIHPFWFAYTTSTILSWWESIGLHLCQCGGKPLRHLCVSLRQVFCI